MALLVVMVLMSVMLTSGLAILSTVDTQTSASRTERVRDSAFNLAESALNAQIFALSRDWPGLGRVALPYGTCTQTTPSPRCPDQDSLVGGASPDLTGATWRTSVHDNGVGVSSFYSDESTQSQPGYDLNDDGKVWVRAQGVAEGRKRTLIALVRAERQEEDLPRGVIAGSLEISNNGNKELIRGNGGTVAVRCKVALLAPVCLGSAVDTLSKLLQLKSLLTTQITGSTAVEEYSAGDGMTAEARARLKATAISDGTYHDSATGCPTVAELTGQIVYLSGLNCAYTSNSIFNSVADPGALILDGSTVDFGGTTRFFGVVYAANTNTVPGGVAVTTQGDALIKGGVVIDGLARMVVGSSGLNISYDVNAFRAITSYGAAGVIQNTFREIRAG